MKTQTTMENGLFSFPRLASLLGLAVVLLVGVLSGRAADSVIYVTNSIALEDTDWSYDLAVPRFDPTLGTLKSATVYLSAYLVGSAYWENLNARSAIYFTARLNGSLSLSATDNPSVNLLQAVPIINYQGFLSAFDGSDDFDGTSGISFPNQITNQVVSMTYTAPADLSRFTNAFAYRISAGANCHFTGGGNVDELVLTSAAADLIVGYTYTPVSQGAGLLACSLAVTPLCSGGNCVLTANIKNGAGGPYKVNWTGPNSLNVATTNTSAAQTLTASAAGTYIATVTDQTSSLTAKATNIVAAFSMPSCQLTMGSSPRPNSWQNIAAVSVFISSADVTYNNGIKYSWTILSSTGSGWAIDQATAQSPYMSFTAGSSGNATFQVTVTTPNGCSSSCSVTVGLLLPACAITPTQQTICSGQSAAFTANTLNMTPPLTYSWTGPNGFATVGQIATVPNITLSSAGNYVVTITDNNGLQVSTNANLTVVASPTGALSAPSTLPLANSTGNTLSAWAVSGGTYQWTLLNASAGWVITAGANSQTVTYTAGSSGTATFQVTVVNASGCSSSSQVTFGLRVAPLALQCVSANSGQIGVAYASAFTASGGSAGYTYSISSGSLPTGLTLNPATGAITGTPSASGTFTFTARVTDSVSATATVSCGITILSAVVVISHGDTATIGFWKNKNGQALINALNGGPTHTELGNWLAATFPYLYGASAGPANNMGGKKNSDVAAYDAKLFNAGGQKADAQVMAGALACYVTSSTLAGTTASSYGFNSSTGGTGVRSYNVGSSGVAIGLSNNTYYTITQIITQANLQKKNGTFSANSSTWSGLFGSGINVQGDIQ